MVSVAKSNVVAQRVPVGGTGIDPCHSEVPSALSLVDLLSALYMVMFDATAQNW